MIVAILRIPTWLSVVDNVFFAIYVLEPLGGDQWPQGVLSDRGSKMSGRHGFHLGASRMTNNFFLFFFGGGLFVKVIVSYTHPKAPILVIKAPMAAS